MRNWLFGFALFSIITCLASNDEYIIIQYRAIALYEDSDTSTILYTFTKDTLYIDEVGNEGFAYRYDMYDYGEHSYLKFYNEFWGVCYEYKYLKRPNGDIVLKREEGDILLEKQKKNIDLGFN